MSGQHCLLAERDISAPISTSVNSSVRLTYFHTNRLLNELYKQETEIRWRKTQTDIDRHSPVSPATSSQPLDPPNFSLPTTFKKCVYTNLVKFEFILSWSNGGSWGHWIESQEILFHLLPQNYSTDLTPCILNGKKLFSSKHIAEN